MDYARRFLQKLQRGCASTAGVTVISIVVAFGVMATNLAPSIVSAASAATRTADPTPTNKIPAWNNDPQQLVTAIRASVQEIWHILSSYSSGRVSKAPLPIIVVVDKPRMTNCKLLETANSFFDPNNLRVGTCANGQTLYYGAPKILADIRERGDVGAFAAFVVRNLLAIKANSGLSDSAAIDARTACLAGAWFGYVTFDAWDLIHPGLAEQMQPHLSQIHPTSFQRGKLARSLKPCFAG